MKTAALSLAAVFAAPDSVDVLSEIELATAIDELATAIEVEDRRRVETEGYDWLGNGFCNAGYYAGQNAADATLAKCAAKCDSEEMCRFFALKEGHTCSRYTIQADSCGNRIHGHADHVSYAKKTNVLEDFEKLGPGHCNSGYYAGWNAADATLEKCSAKCNSEPECYFFSLNVGVTCSRYTSLAGQCEGRQSQENHITYEKKHHADGFVELGNGHCNAGYYAGWNAADATLQACAARCNSESNCMFFSLWAGQTCARYTSGAGICGPRSWGHDNYVTYAKESLVPKNYEELGNGHCASGYYAGWNVADATLSACAQRCDEEAECMFFSLWEGNTCSRYTSFAAGCTYRPYEGGYVSYMKKVLRRLEAPVQDGEIRIIRKQIKSTDTDYEDADEADTLKDFEGVEDFMDEDLEEAEEAIL